MWAPGSEIHAWHRHSPAQTLDKFFNLRVLPFHFLCNKNTSVHLLGWWLGLNKVMCIKELARSKYSDSSAMVSYHRIFLLICTFLLGVRGLFLARLGSSSGLWREIACASLELPYTLFLRTRFCPGEHMEPCAVFQERCGLGVRPSQGCGWW